MLSICWPLFYTHSHSFPFKIHMNSNWFLHEAMPQTSPKLFQWLPSYCSCECLSYSSYKQKKKQPDFVWSVALLLVPVEEETNSLQRSVCCANCQVLMDYLVSDERSELGLRRFSEATWVVWITCSIWIKKLSASWFNPKHYKDTYENLNAEELDTVTTWTYPISSH